MNEALISPRLEIESLPGIPLIHPGDDLAALILRAMEAARFELRSDDILVITSKLFSRAEGRFVNLRTIEISERARELAEEIDKDPALVEAILRESSSVSRKKTGVLIVRHRLGFVSANAGIDASNAGPPNGEGDGEYVLLLPEDPDASATRLRVALESKLGIRLGIILSDSHGRPFRQGTVGTAIGVSGLPALLDHVGREDLLGRKLEYTVTALADQLAAAADLVAGQSDEARPVVRIRGVKLHARNGSASDLLRDPNDDLYA